MTARARSLSVAEINVTPMLDVLLVLLIIFLAASVRVVHTMDAQLPVPCTGACAGGAPIVLEVLPGPTYRINQQLVDPAHLGERIADIYRNRPEKVLQVAGHPSVSYDAVVTAMDVAKSGGVRVLAVAPKGMAP